MGNDTSLTHSESDVCKDLQEPAQVWVSVTGLRLKGFWSAPRFWWLSIAAMNQVQGARGLIRAEARRINGIHHTLSVWESKSFMRAYVTSGAHLKAMQAFRSIATGKTIGFLAKTPPGWDQVHEIWLREGREV